MFIKTFPVGAFQCNCTIIANPKTGRAMIVDPGDEAESIVSSVAAEGFSVDYLIHTHAHIDHIGATKSVHNHVGGQICLHKGDDFLYSNMAMQAQLLGLNMDCDVLPVSKHIEHNDVLECDSALRTKVIHTPGHTPGSVCFLFDGFDADANAPLLFSGDTLFLSSIGRTDLWGGDYGQIIASIKERLFSLPKETRVITGHGPSTTIGYEIGHNPFLQGDRF